MDFAKQIERIRERNEIKRKLSEATLGIPVADRLQILLELVAETDAYAGYTASNGAGASRHGEAHRDEPSDASSDDAEDEPAPARTEARRPVVQLRQVRRGRPPGIPNAKKADGAAKGHTTQLDKLCEFIRENPRSDAGDMARAIFGDDSREAKNRVYVLGAMGRKLRRIDGTGPNAWKVIS